MDIIIVALYSYLAGSIPFGLILIKLFQGKDIRKTGSGNIGATNVLRVGGKLLAGGTLILDILKGYFPVILTNQYYPEFIFLSCLLSFLGHIFPIWLKFKGGKGVATYLGVLFALSYQISFLFIFTWVVVSLIFRYSSVSAMFASMTVFVITLIREKFFAIFFIINENKIESNNQISGSESFTSLNISTILFIFFILIIFTHRKNITNLRRNSEPKIKL